MRRDAGVVLINALVIVLTISVIAAALLARSEAARVRGAHAQGAQQAELYLDAVEGLIPVLLDEVKDGSITHTGQAWAQEGRSYPIDRGRVAARVVDLQGRLNVNWLLSGSAYVEESFERLFAELGLPQSLLIEIAEFVSRGGPRATADYLARSPSVLPRGGPVKQLDDLREVRGMTAAHFAVLATVLAALPVDSRLNLNTAPKVVLNAVLEPLPDELRQDLLDGGAPITAMADIRKRAIEILETEEIDELQLGRFTIASTWFLADLEAELDGARQRRQVVFSIEPATARPIKRLYRWAVYD